MKRFWNKVNKDGLFMPHMSSRCWVWTAYCNKDRKGYGVLRFNGEATPAHRVSWIINFGPIPKDDSFHGTLHVLHHCDNPVCVRPEHLFLGTTGDNARDMCSKNRQHRGENTGGVVATEQQVKDIRDLWPLLKQADLSRLFNLNTSIVHCIVHRKTWKHVV
jgi:hypothetical protein